MEYLLLLLFLIGLIFYILWKPKRILHFGCIWNRWGCCQNTIVPKLDQDGTNCT